MAAPSVLGTTTQESRNPDLIPAGACPRCHAPIISTVTREVRGVVLSDQLCANGDPIFSKWLA